MVVFVQYKISKAVGTVKVGATSYGLNLKQRHGSEYEGGWFDLRIQFGEIVQ